MGLKIRSQQQLTRRLIDALERLKSRMAEFATGINGEIASVGGMLPDSDLTTDEKTLLAQIGQAAIAAAAAVTRLRVLVEAADVSGDIGDAKTHFESVLSGD